MGDFHHRRPSYDADDDSEDENASIEDYDTPEKCRERRLRRIDSRRRRFLLNGARSSPSSGEEVSPPPPPVVVAAPPPPVVGMMSVAGRMREMEDAVCVCMELCRPAISGWLPVHFFAVYDGHGGSHVATLCREKLHVLLQEELLGFRFTATEQHHGIGNGGREERENGVRVENGWRTVMRRAFERMDEVALSTCACGAATFGCNCAFHPVAMALSGSTATVAVVTPNYIIVANCGDSRAVLYRGGRTVALSVDHKPDRPDELARIEAAGGRVIYLKGARVQGILAMSRAIGDKFLKPYVISEPEIIITRRNPEDECLILASDGLWDVVSSDMACKVACKCLQEESRPRAPGDATNMEQDDEGPTPMYPSQSALAAALLTRLALGRESSDNISVIVVDLKSR